MLGKLTQPRSEVERDMCADPGQLWSRLGMPCKHLNCAHSSRAVSLTCDLRHRILHSPEPKGGEKALDIPLSRPMMRSIEKLIRAARILHHDQAEFWLFPADSASGRLVEHKEKCDVLAKWSSELRQSYRTLAQPAGVSELDAHLLINHIMPA